MINFIPIIAVGILMLLGLFPSYCSVDHYTVKVEDKERVVSSSGQTTTSYYLIFTDKGVFKNADSYPWLKFNSSDIYGMLKPGQCYSIKANWFRVRFLSMYENILSAVPEKCKEEQSNG